jgi:hypothetical protein
MPKPGRLRPALLALACLLYLGLFVGRALTTAPYIDESLYSMSAWNLARNGSFGMPVLEPSHYTIMPGWGKEVPGIDKHNFLFMPLPLIVQAAWYKLFGYSLISLRMFSVSWAAIALAACYFLIEALSGSRQAALLGVALIGIDQIFIARASTGRMDMMSAALGFAGLSVYVNLRGRSLPWAICLGYAGVVGSGLSHPNGGMVSFAGLTFLILYLDRPRLRWNHLAWASAPFLIGAAGMALFISVDPELFRTQFLGQSRGRLTAFAHPLSSLAGEVTSRYPAAFGLLGENSVLGLGRAYILLAYLAGMAVACLSRPLRREPGVRALLLLALVYALALTFADDYKSRWYLVYTLPLFAAVTAVSADWLARRGLRAAVAVALLPVFLIPLISTVRSIRQDPYRQYYLRVVDYLTANRRPGEIVMGTATLSFGLGFDRGLVYDDRMGYYSGKRPAMIVAAQGFRDELEAFRESEPDVYRHVMHCLEQEFRPALEAGPYTVFVRRAP